MEGQKPVGIMENTNENGDLLNYLFRLAMQKKWEELVEFYGNNSWAHVAKLNASAETALHVAVSSCFAGLTGTKATYIKKMIDCIDENKLYDVLTMQNKGGNTPLHLAAAVGSIAICDYIASKYPDLIKIRNSKGETPVFRAALHGNTQTFLYFHQFYKDTKEKEKEFESLCRRVSDGNTVLHSAISGAYFGLAYQIICYYPNLVNSVNVDGESPLHVLAKKPNVFKSSSHLGFYDSIVHHCLIVDELKKQEYNKGADESPTSEINFQENYRTCVGIFHFFGDRVKAGYGCDEESQQETGEDETKNVGFFPPNYATCILLVKFGFRVILLALGFGFWRIQKIQKKKQIWTHSSQVMNKMINHESGYKHYIHGREPEVSEVKDLYPGRSNELPSTPPTAKDIDPHLSTNTNTIATPSSEVQKDNEKEKDQSQSVKYETPILVAAKMGITEMVEKILDKCPVAIQDLDSNEKNVLLLAAENRQKNVFDYLVQLNLPEYLFPQVDNKGNSVLHLAATFGESHPWRIPGAALQMQWEINWFEHVKKCIPLQYDPHNNSKGETPSQVFTKTHRKLLKDGTSWLIKTSESCSLIAALIATVAFATSATVPGGFDETFGRPILGGRTAFDVFSTSSVIALCLSVTALVFFLGVITSGFQERDFRRRLPTMLRVGWSCLFGSIAAMLLSFCAGDTFILLDQLETAAYSIYAIVGVPLTLFALGHLSLFFGLLQSALGKQPLQVD